MRHGNAAFAGELLGGKDRPLTEQGRAQALAWRGFFAARPIHALWCSPLSRAIQTAELCLEKSSPKARIVKALREISLGRWEGKNKETIQRAYPKEWEARGRDLFRTPPPGGESFQELAARVWPAFEDVRRQAAAFPAALIVAHQAVNRCILAKLLDIFPEGLFDIPQNEACLNTLRLDGDTCAVEALNLSVNSPEAECRFRAVSQ